ncbi:MAG: tetratricopeptide repeat protein [Chloroflexi bacterium]|nr:tetratricopeptide repeat protein [Chloroflexota bacterium]
MVDLSLRGQYAEAERLLRVSRPADARDICFRILDTFPRHVATYGLLGQAMARLGRRDDAINLFYRVLAADPESAEAHVGLGAAHERRSQLSEALWHYHLACELAPGDVEARQGYLRVRGLSEGEVPRRVPLSRAALARAYARGRLYDLAVWEYRGLLGEEPRRYDLRVGLAEALWRGKAGAEAADVCQSLLTELPNCLKATLILGHEWLGTDRDAYGRALLQRAQALDPDNSAAQDLFGSRSPLPPRAARLPFREDDAPPLDLDYLLDDADAADAADPAAPPRLDRIMAEAGSPPPRARRRPPAREEVPPAGRPAAGERLAGEPPAGERPADEPAATREPEPAAPPRAAWEAMSLIDVQRQYVAQHPEDAQARLDLAQRLCDDGSLYEAIAQYRWLVENDVLLLPQAIDDLEFLNRMYPRTPELHELLTEARFRESRGPSNPA